MKSWTARLPPGAITPILHTQRSCSASSATRSNKRIEAMKAIVIRAYGGPEVMKLDDVELPAPGAGEALVDVAVSGVNFNTRQIDDTDGDVSLAGRQHPQRGRPPIPPPSRRRGQQAGSHAPRPRAAAHAGEVR